MFMEAPRWQFGVYRNDVLLETYSTDIDQFAEVQRAEALRRVDFLGGGDGKSTYKVERIRTGFCIEENGLVVAKWRTSIDGLLSSLEIQAERELREFQQRNPDKKYVIILI